MQIFILLYIEAGSYINEEEDGWEFVVLLVTVLFLNVRDVRDHTCRFEKRKRRDGTATYHFVGYSSLYNFYCFPEKVRLRLRWVKIFLSHLAHSIQLIHEKPICHPSAVPEARSWM